MEKFVALFFTILLILSPVSLAYELNTNAETNLLELFLSALLNIQYKVTGLAISSPYKISPKKESFKIEQVECSTNQIRVLVKSESSSDRNLVYTIKTTRGTKKIFTQHKLESRESNWFTVVTNTTCSNLKTLQVNGYSIDGTRTVYTSTDTYTFTGSETAIATQTTTQSTQILSNPSDRYTYVYLGNNLVERIDGNNNHVFFHEDHLGSTRLATDINGSKVSDNSYEPFGEGQYSSSPISNRVKFTGKEEDKSGLYYFGARYYDPEFGRFTQVDPLYDPLESPYVYVRNNPMRLVDPDGAEAAPADELKVITPQKQYELDRTRREENARYVRAWAQRRVQEFENEKEAEAFRNVALGMIPIPGPKLKMLSGIAGTLSRAKAKLYLVNPRKYELDMALGINYAAGFPKELSLTIKDGVIYFGSKPYHGKAVFVVTEEGILKLSVRRRGIKAPHALLAEGNPVRGSGEVEIHSGRVFEVNPRSGHYFDGENPVEFSRTSLREFYEALEREGGSLTSIYTSGGKGGGGAPRTDIGVIIQNNK